MSILPRGLYKQVENALFAAGHFSAAWEGVVSNTYAHFADSPKGELMQLVFKQGRREGQVCEALLLERSTYFSWKREVVLYAAMLALEGGLISLAARAAPE